MISNIVGHEINADSHILDITTVYVELLPFSSIYYKCQFLILTGNLSNTLSTYSLFLLHHLHLRKTQQRLLQSKNTKRKQKTSKRNYKEEKVLVVVSSDQNESGRDIDWCAHTRTLKQMCGYMILYWCAYECCQNEKHAH